MKMLITVYNNIERDTRVLRQIDSLKEMFQIDVLCYGKMAIGGVNFLSITNEGFPRKKAYRQYVRAIQELCKSNQYSIVYFNDYYSCLPLMFLAKQKNHPRLIYDAHELIIDNTSPRELFFRFMEKCAIKKANVIICASEQRSEIMKDYYNLLVAPTVIRNISTLNVLDVAFTNEEIKWFCSEKKRIIYAGVLKQGRKIELLCSAVKLLEAEYDLLVVGDGEQYDYLVKYCKDNDINNVFFAGGKKSIELGAYISKCDISYLYYPCSDLNNRYCAPNKIYEYTSLALPIISNDNPTMVREFEDNNFGTIFVESSDSNITIKNIVTAIKTIDESMDVYIQASKSFSTKYSWENEKKKLQDIMR